MKGGIIMIVLYIILSIIVVLCVVLLLNAALQTKDARKLEGQHPTFTDEQLEVYGNNPEFRTYIKNTPLIIPFVPIYSVARFSWLKA